MKKFAVRFLLVFCLFDVFEGFSQSLSVPEILNNKYLECFKVLSGNTSLDIYSVSGMKETSFYNSAVDRLKDPVLREKTYKRILKEIALQSNLEITNLFEVINCKNGLDAETITNLYADLAEYSGISADILGLLEKSSGAYSKIPDYKKLVTGISKADLEFMSNSVAVLSILQSGEEIYRQADYLNNYLMLQNATTFDIGLKRMRELKRYNCLQDQAYIRALDEIIEELQNFPVSYWDKLYKTLKDNRNSVQAGVEAFSQAAKDVAQIAASTSGTASAATAASSLGWIYAVVYTYNKIDMIRDWNQEWRDIAMIGTLYANLLKKGYSSFHYENIVDYSQFVFLKKMANCMENSNLVFWEFLKPDQKAVRLYVENDLETVTKSLVQKRMMLLQCNKTQPYSPSKKASIGFIIDSSGSMQSSDPQDIRKSGISLIVDLLSGKENIFLIDFDDQSNWLTSSNWNNWTGTEIKTAISSINSDGGTNVGLGLKRMREALEQNMTDFSKTAVVLLTDGKGTYNSEADWFAENGIRVYTISYKNEADANLLNSIAATTGGIYIQANDEGDVVAAFMQFVNYLQGLNKFFSFAGNFNGQSTINLKPFFVDKGCKQFTCMLNSSGTGKEFYLISPSGIRYGESKSASETIISTNFSPPISELPGDNSFLAHGPSIFSNNAGGVIISDEFLNPELIEGPGYTILKVDNPEPGEWRAVIGTVGSVKSDEDYIFEAMGRSEKDINLSETKSAGTYKYLLSNTDPSLLWEKSKAEIKVNTPNGKEIDVSGNYKNGSFFFYPNNGIGSYQINATIWVNDNQDNTYQRQFSRSELVGELLPGYIAPVKEIMGSYITTEQGTITGNRSGIKCFIYSPGGTSATPKARGYVTHVNDRQCTIELNGVILGRIEKGDIVELDMLQWKNDR